MVTIELALIIGTIGFQILATHFIFRICMALQTRVGIIEERYKATATLLKDIPWNQEPPADGP